MSVIAAATRWDDAWCGKNVTKGLLGDNVAVDWLRSVTPAGSQGGYMGTATPQGTSQQTGRSWQGDRALKAIADRLSRSATIALLLSPAGLLFIGVTRLLIISDYNPVTASAIVSSGGYVDTLLGTLIPLVPIILPYLALTFLFFNRVIPGILALLATAFISPTTMSRSALASLAGKDWHQVFHTHVIILFVMGVLAAVVFVLLLLELAGLNFSIFMRIIATIACIALIPTVALLYPLPFSNTYYAQLVRQPWLPAETITLTSGQQLVGYILSDDGTWIEVLTNDTRTIHYYLATDVAGRQVCQIGQAPPMHPLITLTQAETSVSTPTPICPTSSAGSPPPAPPSNPPIPIRGLR